jgi:N utilization substance protein A
MVEITFSNETVQCIRLASRYSKAQILDCVVEDDRVIFVVAKGQLGVALGLKAKNLEKLRTLFKKTVKFVEFDEDKERFIYNLCKPYTLNKVVLEEDPNGSVVAKVDVERREKSKLIGRDGRNINLIRKLAQRHHTIKDVQIV